VSLYYQIGAAASPIAAGTLAATTLVSGYGPGYFVGPIVVIPDAGTSGAPPGGITFQGLVTGNSTGQYAGWWIETGPLNVPSIATGLNFPTELDLIWQPTVLIGWITPEPEPFALIGLGAMLLLVGRHRR
jgi:hypothetical protein